MSEDYRFYEYELMVGDLLWEGPGWYAPWSERGIYRRVFVGRGEERPDVYTMGLGTPVWFDAPPLPFTGEYMLRERYCDRDFGPDIVSGGDAGEFVRSFFEEGEPNTWYSIEYGPEPAIEYHPFDSGEMAYPQVSIDELIKFVEGGLYE